MVCNWGMSDIIGPIKFGKQQEEVFLGKELSQQKNYSEEKSILIDKEISKLVKNAESNADKILIKFKNQLDDIANELLNKETISGLEMENIIINKDNKKLSNPTKTTSRISRRKKNEIK